MNISRHVYAIIGLGIVMAAVGVASPSVKAKAPNTQNVFVTNTSSNPVPVSVNGTASVSGTVNIGNTAGAPVPVQDVNAAPRVNLSFESGIFFASNDTDAEYSVFYTVPSGKVFVVDTVLVQSFQMPTGERMVTMGLGASGFAEHPVVLQYQGNTADGHPLFVGNFTGSMRFAAGAQIHMYGKRDNGNGVCGGEGVIEGHLENA